MGLTPHGAAGAAVAAGTAALAVLGIKRRVVEGRQHYTADALISDKEKSKRTNQSVPFPQTAPNIVLPSAPLTRQCKQPQTCDAYVARAATAG
jgi:hypothetical protein